MKKLLRHWKIWLTGKDQSFGGVPFIRRRHELQFLLIKHVQGHWDFPKGHAEGFETSLETAEREVKEESGLKEITILPSPVFVEEYSFLKGSKQIRKSVSFFLVEVKNDQLTLQKEEVSDAQWCSFEEALQLITFPAGKKILKQAYEFLRNHDLE